MDQHEMEIRVAKIADRIVIEREERYPTDTL